MLHSVKSVFISCVSLYCDCIRKFRDKSQQMCVFSQPTERKCKKEKLFFEHFLLSTEYVQNQRQIKARQYCLNWYICQHLDIMSWLIIPLKHCFIAWSVYSWSFLNKLNKFYLSRAFWKAVGKPSFKDCENTNS